MHKESFELSSLSIRCLLNDDNNHIDNNRLKLYQIQKIQKRLKLLQHYISNYGICQTKWIKRSSSSFNGLIIAFQNGQISSICFDQDQKYILSVGHHHHIDRFSSSSSSSSKRISSIEIINNGIIIAFIEPYVAMIEFDNNYSKYKLKFKQNNNHRIQQLTNKDFAAAAKRNIAVYESKQLALIWSNRLPQPHNRQVENPLVILRFNNDDFRLIEFNHSINGEILQANFIDNNDGKFGVLHKQKTSMYNLTYSLFDMINESFVENSFEINIPLERLCLAAKFTGQQDKILMLCDDECFMLFNIEQNVLYSLDSSKSIGHFATYPLDSIFVTCDKNGSISFYDIAFQNILHKTLTAESCHHHLNSTIPISIKRIEFISSNMLVVYMVENYRQDFIDETFGQPLLPLSLEKNCDCCLKLITLPYDLSYQRLINEYLACEQIEESLNVLRTINWNCSHEQAFICLNQIFQHLISMKTECLSYDHYLESTLATFLLPMTPIDYKIFEMLLPDIRQLAIRFFYHLIRRGSLEKAYQLSIELKSTRLFLLLSQLFRQNGQLELSKKSLQQAKKLIN